MGTRAQNKQSSRANALKRGEQNARRRGEALNVKAPAPDKATDPVRDGLIWLIRKGRLTPLRQRAAAIYRSAYREPQEGAMRSCLNLEPGGCGAGSPPDCNAGKVDAVRRLDAFRRWALAGHEQLIWVMDGVCGGGLTLREMCGGEERGASKLEAVLMVALDLVGAWDARPATAQSWPSERLV
jgi:hypothetical protein